MNLSYSCWSPCLCFNLLSNESNQAPTTARKRSTSARRSRSKQQKATKKEDPVQRLSSNINSAAIETKSVKRTTRAERRKQKSGAEEQGGNNNENIQPLSSTLLSSTSIGCNKEEVSAQREEPLQENHAQGPTQAEMAPYMITSMIHVLLLRGFWSRGTKWINRGINQVGH